MNIVKCITTELTPDNLREIVAESLKTEGYEADKKNVRFNVERHLEGYGMGEHEVTEFLGCSVTAEMSGAKDVVESKKNCNAQSGKHDWRRAK